MLNFGRTFATVGTSDQVLESSSNHSASTDDVVDLKGDQIENNEIVKNLNLNYKHLWALAITTGIGGHYFAWNEGLSAGFGTYMIATVIISSGFICLIFTLAELSSALPFAGIQITAICRFYEFHCFYSFVYYNRWGVWNCKSDFRDISWLHRCLSRFI